MMKRKKKMKKKKHKTGFDETRFALLFAHDRSFFYTKQKKKSDLICALWCETSGIRDAVKK
jgi:hypothetical protein